MHGKNLPLVEALQQVSRAVEEAEKQRKGKGRYTLDRIELEFELAIESQGDAGFEIGIPIMGSVKAGLSDSQTSTHRIKFLLNAVKTESAPRVAGLRKKMRKSGM